MKLIGSKKAIRSPEFHRKMEFRRKFRFFLFSTFFLLLLVSPIYILRNENFLISEIDISGNKTIKKSEIESLIRESLLGDYLRIIPKSSIVFYPKKYLTETLYKKVPQLASVHFSAKDFKSIEASVVEREPAALYCKGSDEKCFFLDKTGFIYAEAANFSEGVYVVYKSIPEIASPLGTTFLSFEELAYNASFLNNLSKISFTPDTLTKDGDEYSLKLKNGQKILWLFGQDLERLFLDLEAFLKSTKIKQSDLERVSSFDLRVDNKIFYKSISE